MLLWFSHGLSSPLATWAHSVLLPFNPLQVHWSATGWVFLGICSVKRRKHSSGVTLWVPYRKAPQGKQEHKEPKRKEEDNRKAEGTLLWKDKMRSPWLRCDPQKYRVFVTFFWRNSAQYTIPPPIFVINQMTEKQMSLIRTLRFTVQVINWESFVWLNAGK